MPSPDPRNKAYWRKTIRITSLLLTVWVFVTVVSSWFARELNQLTVLGFPLGFYMGAQGALIVYALIVWFYAWYMNRLDREFQGEGKDGRERSGAGSALPEYRTASPATLPRP